MEKLLLMKDDLNEEADYEEEDDEFLDDFSNDENENVSLETFFKRIILSLAENGSNNSTNHRKG